MSPNRHASSGPFNPGLERRGSARRLAAGRVAPPVNLHRHLVLQDALTPLARGAVAFLPIGSGDLVALHLAEAFGESLARDDELAFDLADRGGELLPAGDELARIAGIGVTGF